VVRELAASACSVLQLSARRKDCIRILRKKTNGNFSELVSGWPRRIRFGAADRPYNGRLLRFADSPTAKETTAASGNRRGLEDG